MLNAVVYVQDLAGMQAFYERVAKLPVIESGDDYVVMGELVLVEVEGTHDGPVIRREDSAVKLVFDVTTLAAARVRAAQLGGVVDPASEEWEFGGYTVCDGHDPEGNPLQLREPA